MTISPEYTDTIIIGAGPAGLATAACLKHAGKNFIILERTHVIASSWRTRYHRLHLHTNNRLSSLPHRRFPKSYPRYPSLQQVIDYLDDYAVALGLHPRFGEAVSRVYCEQNSWHTLTEQHHYISKNVVVASGVYGQPYIPTLPGQDEYQGEILHSSRYIDGTPYRGKRVLVVGFGNSGGEIAIDLVEHGAYPALAVRGPVNIIPRDVLTIPIVALALPLSYLPSKLADWLTAPVIYAAFGNLSRMSLKRPAYGPFTQIKRQQRPPVIDIGTVKLIRDGKIEVRPGISHFTPSGVVFADHREAAYDAVILATGFTPSAGFIDGISTETHASVQRAPGLYFCGFSVTATGMLREIGLEARAIAALIGREQPLICPLAQPPTP